VLHGEPTRFFSLPSEATAEGKFGRVAGNIGIRCRQPRLVAANHQAFSFVFLRACRLSGQRGKSANIGSQSVNTRALLVERQCLP